MRTVIEILSEYAKIYTKKFYTFTTVDAYNFIIARYLIIRKQK